MGAGGVQLHAALGFTVEEPEGNVDALQLFDLVVGAEGFGEEALFSIVFFQSGDGILLFQAEGENIVRPQGAGKLTGNDRRVAAVDAGGGGGRFVADEFRAAGGADIGTQLRGLGFVPLGAGAGGVPGFLLRGLLRLFRGVLLGFERASISSTANSEPQ